MGIREYNNGKHFGNNILRPNGVYAIAYAIFICTCTQVLLSPSAAAAFCTA